MIPGVSLIFFFFFLNIVVNCQFLSKFNTFLWEAEVKVQLRLIYRVTRNLKLDERDQWENWKASFLKFILLNDISKFLYKCFQHFQRTSLKPSDEISSLIIWPKKLESSNLNLLKTCVYIYKWIANTQHYLILHNKLGEQKVENIRECGGEESFNELWKSDSRKNCV